MADITEADLRNASHWLSRWSRDLEKEVPLRLHKREEGYLSPEFSDEFVGYVGELDCKVDSCEICADRKKMPKQSVQSETYKLAHRSRSRTRTTKALRKLRRIAPLEFDVLRLMMVQRLSPAEVAARLTERSYARGFNETYDVPSVIVLAVTGVEKVSDWF